EVGAAAEGGQGSVLAGRALVGPVGAEHDVVEPDGVDGLLDPDVVGEGGDEALPLEDVTGHEVVGDAGLGVAVTDVVEHDQPAREPGQVGLQQPDPQPRVTHQHAAQDHVHQGQLRLHRVGAQIQEPAATGVPVDADRGGTGAHGRLVEGQRDVEVLHG